MVKISSIRSVVSALQAWLLAAVAVSTLLACEDPGPKSAKLAAADLPMLLQAAETDVQEVRTGLPEGAKQLVSLFRDVQPELPTFDRCASALERARSKTPDLRVAKSTFFAVATPNGRVLRNDQKQDLMAGKQLYDAFPALKELGSKAYLEAKGSMPEAAGVRGREDAQWVAGVPIKDGDRLYGLYVTGWSWSAYAYRLEMALRSSILSRTESGAKVPLTYVYVVVDGHVYGAPVSPAVNGKAVLDLNPLEKVRGGKVFEAARDIEGRSFGIAVGAAPALGPTAAIAIVRSET